MRFTLVKENLDSHAALMLLSRMLHVPASAFNVEGTKDKRGVTVQQVTAHKVCRERGLRVSIPGANISRTFKGGGDT